MIKDYVDLRRNEKFERKIKIACDFHSAKYEFTQGRILNVDRTNVSFIEPHRFIIKVNDIALVLLCYDNLNLYLYDKDIVVNVPLLKELIEKIRSKNYGA